MNLTTKNLDKQEVDIIHPENKISFLSMEIIPMENFSFIKRKNTADSKKSFVSNSKDLLVIKQLIDNENYITFSASKQNSIKEKDIIKQISINDSVITEMKINSDLVYLDEYLKINKSISDLSDVSLDSIDSNSIKTDFSD
jgi:hypothetical protein